jgi:hypothetical protein
MRIGGTLPCSRHVVHVSTARLKKTATDVRKAHEQPAIGVLLCASKNDEVVEYALSRSFAPALIAEYQTHAESEYGRTCAGGS